MTPSLDYLYEKMNAQLSQNIDAIEKKYEQYRISNKGLAIADAPTGCWTNPLPGTWKKLLSR